MLSLVPASAPVVIPGLAPVLVLVPALALALDLARLAQENFCANIDGEARQRTAKKWEQEEHRSRGRLLSSRQGKIPRHSVRGQLAWATALDRPVVQDLMAPSLGGIPALSSSLDRGVRGRRRLRPLDQTLRHSIRSHRLKDAAKLDIWGPGGQNNDFDVQYSTFGFFEDHGTPSFSPLSSSQISLTSLSLAVRNNSIFHKAWHDAHPGMRALATSILFSFMSG